MIAAQKVHIIYKYIIAPRVLFTSIQKNKKKYDEKTTDEKITDHGS